MNPLKCGICGHTIGGMTGLQEIQRLMAHLKRKHNSQLTMTEALELRVEWEKKQEVA